VACYRVKPYPYLTRQKVASSIPDGISKTSLTQSFRLHYGQGVDSASNKYEYQGYLLG